MRVIYDTWQKQVTAHPEHADFDLEFAKAHSYPYINAKSEDPLRGKLYRWENNLENLSLLALWLMLWCPIPILLTKRKLRIAFVGLLIASVLTFGGLPFFHGVILRTGIPFTYRFFDDYAYVNGLNWSAERSQQENIVIAYERVSSYPKCREVLLMNGVPTFVNESCLHKILTLQREGKPVSIEMHVCGTGLNCD